MENARPKTTPDPLTQRRGGPNVGPRSSKNSGTRWDPDPLDYIGDDFYSSAYSGDGDGDGGGGGYFLYSQGGQQSMTLDDDSAQSPAHQAHGAQDRRAEPNGKGPPAKDGDQPGKGPPARDAEHPGKGQSALHHRSPVWNHWGTSGQLLSFAPPALSIRYEVDPAGNLLSVTDVLGHQTSYTYNSHGNATSVTDPNGDTTAFAYDASGNLLVLIDPVGNLTTCTTSPATCCRWWMIFLRTATLTMVPVE